MSIIDKILRRASYLEFRQVIVNLKSGTSLKGIVWENRTPLIIIKDVALLSDRGQPSKQPTKVDGEVVVWTTDIDFIQVT